MLYASAKNLLKQSLNGVTFVVEGQQLSDIQYEDVSLKFSFACQTNYASDCYEMSREVPLNIRAILL